MSTDGSLAPRFVPTGTARLAHMRAPLSAADIDVVRTDARRPGRQPVAPRIAAAFVARGWARAGAAASF